MATATETVEEKEKTTERKLGVEEYLSAPRRNRKKYILMALNPDFDRDLSSGMEAYLKKTFGEYSLLRPKSSQELARLMNRQIVLVVIDDDFSGIEDNIQIVKSLKEKKTEETIPVVFLTDHEEQLILEYNKKLLLYQEMDNYVSYKKMPLYQICARLQSAVTSIGSTRKSRRYKVDLRVHYRESNGGEQREAMLNDLSIHGGVLQVASDRLFRLNEQLIIRIPIGNILPTESTDFLRLFSRVRRVFMSGSRAGISWDLVSEKQFMTLTKFLLELVTRQTTVHQT